MLHLHSIIFLFSFTGFVFIIGQLCKALLMMLQNGCGCVG